MEDGRAIVVLRRGSRRPRSPRPLAWCASAREQHAVLGLRPHGGSSVAPIRARGQGTRLAASSESKSERVGGGRPVEARVGGQRLPRGAPSSGERRPPRSARRGPILEHLIPGVGGLSADSFAIHSLPAGGAGVGWNAPALAGEERDSPPRPGSRRKSCPHANFTRFTSGAGRLGAEDRRATCSVDAKRARLDGRPISSSRPVPRRAGRAHDEVMTKQAGPGGNGTSTDVDPTSPGGAKSNVKDALGRQGQPLPGRRGPPREGRAEVGERNAPIITVRPGARPRSRDERREGPRRRGHREPSPRDRRRRDRDQRRLKAVLDYDGHEPRLDVRLRAFGGADDVGTWRCPSSSSVAATPTRSPEARR